MFAQTAGMQVLTPCASVETLRNSKLSGKHASQNCVAEVLLAPHDELDYSRLCYREAEVIHSRWAMLGVLGLIIPDVLGAPLYMLPELGTERLLPFTIIVVTAFGGLEAYRVQSILQGRDLNSRVYPGGKRFDPLGLAKGQQAGQKEPKSPGRLLLLCNHVRHVV